MQHEARDGDRADGKQAAIFAIPGNGMADCGEMGAQLVHAAGFGLEFEQSGGRCGAERAVARLRRLAGRGNLHDVEAVARDFHQRHPLAGVRVSVNDMGATPAVVSLRLDQAVSELAP